MWLQFFSQNVHFVVNLFAALVCMGICWLYLDAWANRRAFKELMKWLGFGLLGLSFLIESTLIEQSVLGKSILGHWTSGLVIGSRLPAYLLIIIGQVVDPLQSVPKNSGLKLESQSESGKPIASEKNDLGNKKSMALVPFVSLSSKVLMPIGSLAIAGLYWRRATTGLERHLKPAAYAFLLFTISDTIGLFSLLRNTTNPVLYSWVAAFGWLWWLEQLTLTAGVIILGFWTWSYLLERFFSQLFMIFTSMVLVAFMVVSVGFTGLLLRDIRTNELVNLKTASNVLIYALAAKQGETASAAAQLAGSSDVVAAINSEDREKLKSLTNGYLADKKLNGLIITNYSGQVLLRGQDTEQWGDSLSEDAIVKRALLGLNQSTVSVIEGVGAPIVQVRSVVPIKDNLDNIRGSIITSLSLDTAFVDGIKQATGLQSSIYGGNSLSATTLTAANGKSRPAGVKLSDEVIKRQVLDKGETYSGSTNLQNRQMLAVLSPIKDIDNDNVGMLLVAEPQSAILATAGRSVELTFLITTTLLLLSVGPIYLVTKVLTRELS